MGYLGATLTQVFMRPRAGRADVSLRDVTIARDEKRMLASANDVTHGKHAEDLGSFLKSQLVDSGEDGWFSLARGDLCGVFGVGADEKNQNRKITPLSLLLSKNL